MVGSFGKRSMLPVVLVVGVLSVVPAVMVVQAQQSADRTGAIIFPDELSTRYEQERETLAKEKRESSRRRNDEASDGRWDADDVRYEYDNGSEEFDGLPVSYALQLSELNSTADMLNLLDPDSIDQRVFMDGGEYSGRDIGENPVPASCEPEMQLVSLRPENLTNPRYYFYPSCTRVKRCSGCCNTNQLVCEPVANRTILYKVTILEYRSGKKDRFSHRELVEVQEHVRCKCQCRVKEWHCTERQVYNPNNCRCDCTNREDRNRCVDEPLKQWNPNTCTCDCLPRNEECTSGSHYDRSACKCLPNEYYAYDGVASYWDHQQQQQQQQQQRPISLARSAASGRNHGQDALGTSRWRNVGV